MKKLLKKTDRLIKRNTRTLFVAVNARIKNSMVTWFAIGGLTGGVMIPLLMFTTFTVTMIYAVCWLCWAFHYGTAALNKLR